MIFNSASRQIILSEYQNKMFDKTLNTLLKDFANLIGERDWTDISKDAKRYITNKDHLKSKWFSQEKLDSDFKNYELKMASLNVKVEQTPVEIIWAVLLEYYFLNMLDSSIDKFLEDFCSILRMNNLYRNSKIDKDLYRNRVVWFKRKWLKPEQWSFVYESER